MLRNLHTHYMQYALRLGGQSLGLTGANPSVGCVIVKKNTVLGVGRTQNTGRPHAETQAIAMAGTQCKGATAYVSLEPCAHVGNTPSCAHALVDAGILECYIATTDPDSRTNGDGIKILQSAGIKVHVGLLEQQAQQQHAGFFKKVESNRPFITVKIASSMDGKSALSNGQSKWITNEKSRNMGHYLRSTHDAILVGANTIRRDNPTLDCRLHGMEYTRPIRVVLGNDIPDTSTVLQDGFETHVLSGDLDIILHKITELGITRLLVEGGANTIGQFIQSGYVDCIAHFQAGKVMGNESLSSIGRLNLTNMIHIPTYKVLDTQVLDDNIYTLYGQD